MTLSTTNPRTCATSPTSITETHDVSSVVVGSLDAFEQLGDLTREWRADLLDGLANSLERHRDELVSIADSETALGVTRLTGEVARSAFQFRLFAEALREGSYLEAAIDHSGDSALGPVPDIRRMLMPIGPVAVFGSSNFPFAFSVAGGDTASALAAGNPVIVKAHGSHLLTSEASYRVLSTALADAGAPEGTLSIVYGTEAGRRLVAHPGVRAVGFTGSVGAATSLMAIIDQRETPIPFYGELSSVNPLVVTPSAAEERGAEIAEGLFASFTMGAGQFCTKPGLAFVPIGESGDALVAALVQKAANAEVQYLLNERIASSLDEIRTRLVDEGGATLLHRGSIDGMSATPSVLQIAATALTESATEEAFGPLLVVARYADVNEVSETIEVVPQSLTATILYSEGEADLVVRLTTMLAPRAGRLVYNGYPTGVRVSWAQHHGGNWPATNSLHTSVGVTAIRRFLRPFAWQNAPQAVLPSELHEGPSGIPRRIDGSLVPAGGGPS